MRGVRVDHTGMARNMRREGFVVPPRSLFTKTMDERARDLMWKYRIYFFNQNDCWRWPLSLNSKGYGVWWWEGRVIGARRWVYQQALRKKLPAYKVVNRTTRCPHQDCVRPSHMIVSRKQNRFTKKGLAS